MVRLEQSAKQIADSLARDQAASEAFRRATDQVIKDDLQGGKTFALEVERLGTASWSMEAELLLAMIAFEEGDYAEAIALTDHYWPDQEIPLRSLIRAQAFLKVGLEEKAQRLWSWYISSEKLIAPEESIVYKKINGDFRSQLLIAYSTEASSQCPLRSIKWLKPLGLAMPRNARIAVGIASALRTLKRESDTLPFLAIAVVYGEKGDQTNALYEMQKFSPQVREAALNQVRIDPLSAYSHL
ncbi:MAG: hypothetical protein EOP09_19545 [Proteobacteria bacterium]|nr:MAG: hypothetical protein EOP09_19545 [Pseudomonadota bacterium]